MSNALANAHVRIARPTNDLDPIKRFYCEGLGLKVVYEFYDENGSHEGFDGIMLGSPNAPYHFEFTVKKGHEVPRAPTEDNLTVFYLPDGDEWKTTVERMTGAGYPAVLSFNPYWDRFGKTFEDPDGYRIVLCSRGWKNPEV